MPSREPGHVPPTKVESHTIPRALSMLKEEIDALEQLEKGAETLLSEAELTLRELTGEERTRHEAETADRPDPLPDDTESIRARILLLRERVMARGNELERTLREIQDVQEEIARAVGLE